MSGQRIALIIANDEYDHEALRDLLAPAADAKALGRVLGDRQIGDFTVQVMRNEPAHVIQAQIEDLFSKSRPDDVLLLHFSGHGLKSESGELFFAASNTRPDRLRATAVSADFVQRCMQDGRSRSVVLLLDCCYGGAFAQGVTVRAAGDVNVLDSFPQERNRRRARPGGNHRVQRDGVCLRRQPSRRRPAPPAVAYSPPHWSRDWPPGRQTGTRMAGSRSTNYTTTSSTRSGSRIRIRPRAARSSWRATCTWPAAAVSGSARHPSRLTCKPRWPTRTCTAASARSASYDPGWPATTCLPRRAPTRRLPRSPAPTSRRLLT